MAVAPTRDLRLDFFRGLGLLFIFLDHIPGNSFSYLTLANFAFCDATEIFVFISGFSAALVFAGILDQQGTPYAMVQVLKRCWTLYIAHIFLFVVFIAQVSYTAQRFDNPMFLEEMRVADFLQEPHIAVLHALALRLQPPFLDILPLYIVLLSMLAFLLPLLRRWPAQVLGVAWILYAAAAYLHFNIGTYPSGVWYFNPFAWQILFLLGAVFAMKPKELREVTDRRITIWISASVVILCAVVRATSTVLSLIDEVPAAIEEITWLIADKTNFGPLRLLNFLAIAHVTVAIFRRGHPFFATTVAQPIVRCGQFSLNVFCLGIFLSFIGHFMLVEIHSSIAMQFAVSAGGILIMVVTAYFLAWSRQRRRPGPAGTGEETRLPRSGRPPEAAVQGGE